VNRLRHLVSPYVAVEGLAVSGSESEEFIQMDGIDAVDDTSRFAAGVRQKLQTKRKRHGEWRSVDFLELDVDYVSRHTDSVTDFEDDRYLEADLEWRATEEVRVHSRDNRISLSGETTQWNVGFDWQPDVRTWLSMDYDYISDVSSAISGTLVCDLSDRWRLLAQESYELDSGGQGGQQNLETEIVLRRILHRWLFDVGVEYSKANDNLGVTFGFGPLGVLRQVAGGRSVGPEGLR
jgi:hypothetical protein